jgi:transposase
LKVRKKSKVHSYWVIVRTVRTPRGPCQELVSYLGELSATEEKEYARIRRIVAECEPVQLEVFDEEAAPEWVKVHVRGMRVGRVRSFGGVWLALKLWSTLGFDKLLESVLPEQREERRWGLVGCILTIARFDHPGSELSIEDRWYEQTALADLLGVSPEKVNTDRLYRGLDVLLAHKREIQEHLRDRYRTLFETSYDILLYDGTSSYFEGQAQANALAARGYSRDHRPDCKQVCIGLVVTKEGLPLAFEVFEGNTHDSETLQQIVEKMEGLYGEAQGVWVVDRGIVSEENLQWLRGRGGQYLVGTPRSMLKHYEAQLHEQDWRQVYEDVEVKPVPAPDGEETFLLCRSRSRREKEAAMHRKFVERIDSRLTRLQEGMETGRLQDLQKINRKIGALLDRNTRAGKAFTVDVKQDQQGKLQLCWTKRTEWLQWAELSEGAYLLRTNLMGWAPEQLWKTYVQLTQVENAFRTCKSDLEVRPIWRHTAERTQGHVLVCFLAYVLWKTLEKLCEASGLGASARTVQQEIQRLVAVDVLLPTQTGQLLKLRCVAEPDQRLKELLDHLGFKAPRPLRRPESIAKAM